MRLNLYWRGYDLIDIEAHLIRRRRDDEEQITYTLIEPRELESEGEHKFGFQGPLQ